MEEETERKKEIGGEKRILSGEEIRKILYKGMRFSTTLATLYCLPSIHKTIRSAIIVSSKPAGACVRNRLKRLFREAFRLNKEKLISGVDLIIRSKVFSKTLKYQEVERDFLILCKKAGLLKANLNIL